ncbi:Heat shock 70 kDa protein 12B [Colletotrichum sp. SAR 10_98]|nr:Heat shock 70 kDa protein 12B [Colletotrichum sp. SAR 10_98]
MTKANYAPHESVLPNRSRASLTQKYSDNNIGSYNDNNGGGSYKSQIGDTGEDVLVIGIDFGTTFSGVAWATAADFESDGINLITSWPDSGREEGKVPTEVFYEKGQFFWGYDIPLDADPVRWFKLLLLKDEDLSAELRESEFLIRARKHLRENRKRPVDLIADYLRALFQHTLNTIERARGDSIVDALRFHVVITVPAIWKDYARQGMEQAAELAGIMRSREAGQTRLTFAPEPEAAALSTLCEPGRNPKKDNVFIICDAGGGTVVHGTNISKDLINYKVTNSKPLAIEEAAEGTGRLCGGIFIDEAFEMACRDRLGRQWSHLSAAGIKEIMKRWEVEIKSQFNPGAKHKEYPVGIPAEAFKASHIKETFADSFKGIDKLIDSQIEMARRQGLAVTGIILVGGLGSSPYFYGIKYTTVFDPMHHNRKDQMWDELEGQKMASNQMRWYLKRGHVVSKKNPVRHDFYELVKTADEFNGKVNITLWCRFQIDIPTPFSELKDFKTASGRVVKKLSYEIEMIPSGASLDIAVYMAGKKLGSRSVRVE